MASTARQVIVSNINLDKLGRARGIERFITVADRSYFEAAKKTKTAVKLIATTVEALFGAVYKDSHGDLETLRHSMKAFGLIKK